MGFLDFFNKGAAMRNMSLSSVFCPPSSRLVSLASCFATLLATANLFAAVPVSINVAGSVEGVARSGVSAPANATVMYMVFRLYAEPGTGRVSDKGTALWGRQAAVSLENGAFDVDLSDGLGSKVDGAKFETLAEAVEAVLKRGSSVCYLGITPENDANAEIFPRLRITAVPKALQAAVVRTVPESFSVTGGVFRADEVVVENAATLAGSATYASASFTAGKTVSFKDGLNVEGPLTAGDVEATTVANVRLLTTDALKNTSSTALTVTGPLTVAGAPTWNGNVGANTSSGPTTAVSVVRGNVAADRIGEARELVINDFANESGHGFDSCTNVVWNVLGDWVTIDNTSSYEGVDRTQIVCWDETLALYVQRTAVTGGRWQAPCDCLAYFQTHVESASASYGACVQFYVLDSADETNFADRTPNAVVSMRNGGPNSPTLETTAPLVLSKGQYVKWFGYNPDQNEGSSIPEVKHSHVSAIRYRPFNWR